MSLSERNNLSNNVGDEKEKDNPLMIPLMPPKTHADREYTKDPEGLNREISVIEETTCGIGCIQGQWMQKFANKNVYVFIYGLLGCIFSASYAYSNGIITTLEKRFKIPSKTIGVITVGNDFTQLFVSVFLSYYAGKGHRPRWIAFGIYTVVAYCLLTALPHIMYGPGEDSLALTLEYGAVFDRNASMEEREKMERKVMCAKNGTLGMQCDSEEGNFAPVVILFLAQLVSGVGGSLYYTIGVSYMDDNIKKDKTPALISFSYFLRMLGPCLGYGLASICLKLYISPTLSPTIDTQDPRWLGAWWLGWIVLAVLLFVFASVLGLFPKTLPRAAARRMASQERKKAEDIQENDDDRPASISDMMTTFKRLLTNPTLMCNNAASVFYFFGYMPYWIYMPKYIETQYRQSASSSSLITGTVGLVFSAIGILLSGLVITKYRPNARHMALWNTMVGLVSVFGIISYVFLGCPDNDSYGGVLRASGELETSFQCNAECLCEYVKYSPVCSQDGYTTYISACHAGCRGYEYRDNGSKVYTNCSCISPAVSTNVTVRQLFGSAVFPTGGAAIPGACPVDCTNIFYMFLAVVCLLKFSGATGRATNFLVSVRCVAEKDKPVAMGLGITLMSLFAFMPSPIFFGYLMDATCLVWGKTCTGTGNCWLYNGESLRYLLNLTSAGFVLIGTVFDAGVWYFVKNLQIFDDEEEKITEKPVQPEEGKLTTKSKETTTEKIQENNQLSENENKNNVHNHHYSVPNNHQASEDPK